MKKRLLTLALALAAVCALAVTAMAATPTAGLTWTGGSDPTCTHTSATEGATTAATCITAGSKAWTCDACGATATETIPATGTHVYQADDVWTSDGTKHWHKCTADANCTAKKGEAACATTSTGYNADGTDHWQVCATCSQVFGKVEHVFAFQQVGTDQHQEKCSICSYTKAAVACSTTMEHTYSNTHHFDKCSKCSRTTTPVEHEAATTWTVADIEGVSVHYKACTEANCDFKMFLGTHTLGAKTYVDLDKHSAACSVCNETVQVAHTFTATVNSSDNTKHDKTCTCTGFPSTPVTEPHTFGDNGKCTLCNYSNAGVPTTADITTANFSLAAGQTKALAYTVKDANGSVIAAPEKVTFVSSHPAVAGVSGTGVVTAYSAGTATISICIDGVAKDTVTVTVTRAQNIAVTVTKNASVYYFGDKSTANGYSVSDYLISNITVPTGASLANYTVTFTNASNTVGTLGTSNSGVTTLATIGNVYLTITSAGTWSANYTVTYGGNTVLSGSVTITVAPNTGIDILYTTTLGQNVALKLTDFQNFFVSKTSRYSTLNYVRIDSVSGLSGTLCYNHRSNEGYSHTNALGGYFYASPTSSAQYNLSALTFVPAKYGTSYTTGTVTVSFTAFGTDRYNAAESVSGNIVLVYTNGEVKGISYSTAATYTPLVGSDFTNVYKAAISTTITNPSFTIRFLEVPTYGSFYYYATNTGSYANGTALTADSISTFSFTNQSGSLYSIDKLTYVPGRYTTAADTVRYAVYNGNTLLYVGTVTFNAETVVVSYNSYSNGTYFRAYDFFYGNTALLNSQFISFGTPSSGTLYKNYSAGKGTIVTATDYFSYTTTSSSTGLNDVCFIPAANYTGVVEIPFYASSSTTSNYITGTVKIYVVAKPFSDVENNWSTNYINRLYASGIVSGTSATTFSPKNSMKYGEALKMILVAAGYPKQAEGTGSNWARNYLTFAYQQGIVSSLSIDLNAAITRDAMAEIAAKALGLSKASYVNVGTEGPTDSTNGYVYALYNAGIVGGDSSSGKNCFYGSRNINRDEVAKIICNIMDYKG